MNKKGIFIILITLISIIGISIFFSCNFEPEVFVFNEDEYIETFSDEFEGNSIDFEKWQKCPEWQRQDHGGYWEDDCSWVEDGNLVIECKKENGKLLSGAIRSAGKFEQCEGLYRFRVKAEKSEGLWYAVWLMTNDQHNVGNGAVDGAEIDMIEIIANDPWASEDQKMYINSAVHWDGYSENHKSNGHKYFIDEDFFEQWHDFDFIWNESGYKLYMDSKLIWNADGDAYGGTNTKENYIKITAEFGTWCGAVNESLLPAKFYVDYMKVYEKK